MLREGIEDYEYFWLLADKVKCFKENVENSELLTEAEELLNVPETVVKSMTDFTMALQFIYAHRVKVARMMKN